MKFPAPLANKVPAITAGFWVTKILTTAMGEDASDFLVHRLGNSPAVLTGLAVFCISLYLQFNSSPVHSALLLQIGLVRLSRLVAMAGAMVHQHSFLP